MARNSEISISYVLREPKGTKATPIIGIVRFDSRHVKLPTGFSVEPKLWQADKGRVCNTKSAITKTEINNYLVTLENAVRSVVTNLKIEGISLTSELIREGVKKHFAQKNGVQKPVKSALFTFVEEFIDKSPTRANIHSGKHIDRKTVQKYCTVYRVLRDFSDYKKCRIDFDCIDIDFYDSFVSYLTNVKQFSTNNIGKYIQTLKVFLNEASISGINVKQDFKNKRFKVTKEDSESIFLNENELAVLRNLDLANNNRLEKVRDLFLVGCYTGLRFSDLVNIKPEYINNSRITLEQFKTASKVVIPCHPVVKEILVKYNNKLPNSISNQKMNDYLKEICQIAEINELVTKSITKGGKRVANTTEKFNLVSTHTARRSFATNMYYMRIPSITLMEITGHKTEKVFMKYIKITKEEHAKIMADVWLNHYK